MNLRDMPIRRKLMLILLATSIVVMLLMRGVFFTYEFITFRQATVRQLTTLGQMLAANSTAALAFENEGDAKEVLSALQADPHIVAAALYDLNGDLFARYPAALPATLFPSAAGAPGYRFVDAYLIGFQPVLQRDHRLGALYLKYDAGAIMQEWLWGSLRLALGVMGVILLVAYLMSRLLQRQISQPILDLAQTATAITEHQDYAVRASVTGTDELGRLTTAFNLMLDQIEQLNREQEQRVLDRTAELAAANDQLQVANRELEAFSYSVSHDLRAPLRHIDGFTSLLHKHVGATLDEKGQRYLTTISAAARQMGRLIDDLLAFSRISRSELNTMDIDTDALVAGVIRDGRFERLAQPPEWSIASLPHVRGDAAMLRQVWFNLIDNAVKYSGKSEHPKVTVATRTDPATGDFVFSVSDNGVGFDMQYVAKLFGVFQRLHGPAEFEGTGIGLANVQRIVVRHGGRVWAEGKVGEGATFSFSLPNRPAPPPAAPPH